MLFKEGLDNELQQLYNKAAKQPFGKTTRKLRIGIAKKTWLDRETYFIGIAESFNKEDNDTGNYNNK